MPTQPQSPPSHPVSALSASCTPEFVQDSDFTEDGSIGQVEFIHLLQDLAPPSCNIIEHWQSPSRLFQSTLQELSCLCTDSGMSESRCCGSSQSASFAVPGNTNIHYDQAVCQRITSAIQKACHLSTLPTESAAPADNNSDDAVMSKASPSSNLRPSSSSSTVAAQDDSPSHRSPSQQQTQQTTETPAAASNDGQLPLLPSSFSIILSLAALSLPLGLGCIGWILRITLNHRSSVFASRGKTDPKMMEPLLVVCHDKKWDESFALQVV